MNSQTARLKYLLVAAFLTINFATLFSQTNGDALIYPNNTIGKKIDVFFYDLKGWPNAISSSTVANSFFVSDDMNGVRVSIYGDETRPAHPSEGVVDESYYTVTLTSLERARVARGTKDFYIFASKKLDGQNSFPAWTKDADGVISTEYVKLLTDYLLFMKNKGYEVDYLAIQNEEQYNEANITAQKHKEIIDALRIISVRDGFKMPIIVGYEDYGPNREDFMKNMKNNNWMDRMDVYGTHYYPQYRPITSLKSDLNYAGDIPFWSTEPHWDSKSDVDDWEEAEKAICAFWDQIEVGMSGFMWWDYKRSGNLRGNLMKNISVPIKDAQMIDMDDIDGRVTTSKYYGNLHTRAFREENKITVYAINNNATKTYTDYGFGISTASIVGNVSSTQWLKSTGSITGENANITAENSKTFRMTLPAESITMFTFDIDTEASVESQHTDKLSIVLSNNKLKIVGVDQQVNYQIYNITGKLLINGTYNNEIDVSTLYKGVYLLRISNGLTSRFIL